MLEEKDAGLYATVFGWMLRLGTLIISRGLVIATWFGKTCSFR